MEEMETKAKRSLNKKQNLNAGLLQNHHFYKKF